MAKAGPELPDPALNQSFRSCESEPLPHSIESPPLLPLLLRLWRYFSRRRQRQLILLLLLALSSALAEALSLGTILPFLGILTAPDRVIRNPRIGWLVEALQITRPQQLVLLLTLTFVVAVLASGAIRMLLLWANTRYTSATGSELALEVYRRTLYQPYQVHLARNSSEVITGIINKVNTVVGGIIQSTLTLISSLVFLTAIMAALLAIDPLIASIAAFGFGTAYALIILGVRRRLARESRKGAGLETQVLKALQEGLGGIRDVLLDGTQPVYCDIFRNADHPLRRAIGNHGIIAQTPRYFMEAIGMVLIAGLAFGLSLKPGGLSASLPILGALALGAQRMLPALQQSYASWVTVSASQAPLADTLDFLDQPLPQEALGPPPLPLPFQDSIQFKGVRFRYSTDGPWVLDHVDLRIPKGARIGFVGTTGSGKSTAMDLLMGLLTPTEGEIEVDGEPLRGPRIRAWQRALAHVPQSIFLADTTLAENIAFGVPEASIDMDRVRQAALQGRISEFIERRQEGYRSRIGERGIRLSGGQRQRIGIARALYKEAMVLVFDEATSALDNATEQSVMEAIEGLDRDLTILIIAHRLTTVRRCDTIVQLEQGRVAAQGTYDEMMETSESFRRMARDVESTA